MRLLRFFIPSLIFSVILSLSLFAFFQLRKQEHHARIDYLSTQCIRMKNVTSNEVQGGTTVLKAMANVASFYGDDRWTPFAMNMMQGTSWRIVGVALLQELSSTELTSLVIQRNITPTQLGSMNAQVPLTYNRDRYLIITEDVPDVARIGYDYYSDPQRKALVTTARERRNITVSNPSPAIAGSEVTLVFFIPLYKEGNMSQFIGGVSAGYHASNLLPLGVAEDVVLFLSVNGATVYEDPSFRRTSLRHIENVQLADKILDFKCGTNISYDPSSLIILCIGSAASVAFALVSVYVMHLISAKQRSLVARLRVEEDKRLASVELAVSQEALKVKSQFVANISHELRTPLQGLLWMANFLLGTPLNAEQREYAITVQASGESLLQIVNDVLDFSKIEAGKLNLELIPVDMKEFLNQLLVIYKAQAVVKSNSITLQDTLTAAESRVITDPTRLRQILNNLIGNALKFTHEAIVVLRCTRTDDKLLFECIDQGIGMDQQQMDRLFQPYVQGDPSTTRRYGGTGLGLSISKQLVEALGGTIGCVSEVGKGSTFWFTIAYKPTTERVAVVKPDHSPTFKGARMIVADDNSINRRVLGKLLKDLGCSVVMAEDGQQVLQLLQDNADINETNYDCIMMDGFMPELDGYEATKIIRASGNDIPIIAVTANALAGERERCLKLGMNDFITKPIIREHLIAALKRVLFATVVQRELTL